MKAYLAGPMSGIPQFNFPMFHSAAKVLRERHGFNLISPAEQDSPSVQKAAMASVDGKYDASGKVGGETWGDMLARDVKMLADDGIQGIVLLPGWEKSKGARLESFVGTLCKLSFFEYVPDGQMVIPRTTRWVHEHLLDANPNLDAGLRTNVA